MGSKSQRPARSLQHMIRTLLEIVVAREKLVRNSAQDHTGGSGDTAARRTGAAGRDGLDERFMRFAQKSERLGSKRSPNPHYVQDRICCGDGPTFWLVDIGWGTSPLRWSTTLSGTRQGQKDQRACTERGHWPLYRGRSGISRDRLPHGLRMSLAAVDPYPDAQPAPGGCRRGVS